MLEIDLDMTVEEPNSVRMCVDDGDEVAFGIAEAITIKDHNILDNRDLPDQHPISAITGLAEALAQSGKIDTVKRNGVTLPVVNKAVDVEVPTKTSDLTNDSGFITIHDVPTPEAELFPVYITNITEDGPDLVATFSKTLGEILVALQNQKYPIIYGTIEGHTFSIPINSLQIISENPPSYFLDFWANGESINKSVIGIMAMGGPTTRTGLIVDRDYLEQIVASDVTNALGYTPYNKPASGIPKTDLAQSVQTSLGKADTAIQQINYDLGEITIQQGDIRQGTFQVTQTQYNEILALWNKDLCSVSCTVEGQDDLAFLAFKDRTETYEGISFLAFTGRYVMFPYMFTGNVVIAVSASGIGIISTIPDIDQEAVQMEVYNSIQQYKQNEAPLPAVYITKVANTENEYKITTDGGSTAGSLIDAWVNANRSAVGYLYEDGKQYEFFLTDSYYNNSYYYSTWVNIYEDGTLRVIKAKGGNSSSGTQTQGPMTIYNQTRAITNAEIDAICI